MLRDVAYDSLAKRERQRLHLRVANKLSEGDQADHFPRTVAFHLEQAAQAALDLNPGDRTLAERAVDALAHATSRAAASSRARPPTCTSARWSWPGPTITGETGKPGS